VHISIDNKAPLALEMAPPSSEALLLDAIRSHFDQAEADSLRASLRQYPVDWPALFRLAKQHKVWPLLFWQLKSICPESVPPDDLAQLRRDFLDNASTAHRHSQVLLNLISQFKSHQIRVLPFKGPTLAVAGYGNLVLRTAGDLDLLVAPTEADRAIQLLAEQGYRPGVETRLDIPADRQPHGQLELRHPDQPGLTVDLHWRLLPAYNRFQPKFEMLWAGRQAVSLLNETANTLAPEQLLVYLVLHGSKHLWLRLGLVCDVAALVERHRSDLDWPQILAAARQGGYERRLKLAVWLCHTLLAVPLPDEIETDIKADRHLTGLAGQVRGWLFEPVHFRSQLGLKSLVFELKVQERLRDKLRFGWGDALPRVWRRSWPRLVRGLGFK